MNTTETTEMRSLSRVKEWSLNPRQGTYENLDELQDSLQRHGLQDAIHVWERTDGDYLLKGHRRFAAMQALGWTECQQVVHHFDDEATAYKYLLEDHGHTVPLNPEEKVRAVENGVKIIGLTVEELTPSMGMSQERVQLLFDLGEMLPQTGREALARGTLSLHVAELVLQVPDAADRKEAVQLVLHDAVTNEPLGFKAAKNLIEYTFVRPRKWLENWIKKQGTLKKKFRVSDGYQIVEFEQRMEYVLGEQGQPQPEYELADIPMPKDSLGRLWEEVAKELQVPIFVCPAPLHVDGHVLLVNKRMIRDALEVLKKQSAPAEEPQEEDAPKPAMKKADELPEEEDRPSMRRADEQYQPGEDSHPVAGADEAKSVSGVISEAMGDEMRIKLGKIFEHLSANPTDCMSQGPWRLLHDFLVRLVTDVDAGACQAWLGITDVETLKTWIAKDKVQRSGMRIVLMLLLCAESDASERPLETINAMLAELGVEA
jgi:ParB/RepB/Spo0J family partition protein